MLTKAYNLETREVSVMQLTSLGRRCKTLEFQSLQAYMKQQAHKSTNKTSKVSTDICKLAKPEELSTLVQTQQNQTSALDQKPKT